MLGNINGVTRESYCNRNMPVMIYFTPLLFIINSRSCFWVSWKVPVRYTYAKISALTCTETNTNCYPYLLRLPTWKIHEGCKIIKENSNKSFQVQNLKKYQTKASKLSAYGGRLFLIRWQQWFSLRTNSTCKDHLPKTIHHNKAYHWKNIQIKNLNTNLIS